MTMPAYSLYDHIGWTMTRHIPLRSDSVITLKNMISNTYTTFTQLFAGITSDTSMAYIQPFRNLLYTEGFVEEANAIIMPYSFLDFLDVPYVVEYENLTAPLITTLFNCLEMTDEFEPFITALQGITPETSQEWAYKSVIIYEIMPCPKFIRDAQTFPLPT